MVQQLRTDSNLIYPDSDGQPISNDTQQFRWIVTIKENLELLYADDPNVFVAGDLLWYPIEGDNTLSQAPDTLVVFGRPKRDRGSYQQWEEDNIPPQVVFEILSPGNRLKEMAKKFQFYERYGVEEYYVYDPSKIDLIGWQRKDGYLDVIETIQNWVSPRLAVRFVLTDEKLEIYRPDNEPFLTYTELGKLREQETQRAVQAEAQLAQEKKRADRLAARLKELGVDPDAV
ncbi:MAG: Uma2 family endonuclease [Cyanobacteria bacterium J06635_1]